MTDYVKIEQSHKLSEYQVHVPTWSGTAGLRTPFSAWSTAGSLVWYQTYNTTKHDRHMAFQQATFEVMVDAVCGCLTILSAQFQDEGYSGRTVRITTDSPNDRMSEAIGDFRIKYPQNWPATQRYDFDWRILERDPDPFRQYPYPYPYP